MKEDHTAVTQHYEKQVDYQRYQEHQEKIAELRKEAEANLNRFSRKERKGATHRERKGPVVLKGNVHAAFTDQHDGTRSVNRPGGFPSLPERNDAGDVPAPTGEISDDATPGGTHDQGKEV